MPRRLYLVAYDISCRKRWRRVFKYMKRRGDHRQLSVFIVRCTPSKARSLANRLEEMIDPDEDTVLVVAIDEQAASSLVCLGKSDPIPESEVVIV